MHMAILAPLLALSIQANAKEQVSGITWKTGSTRVSCTKTCGTDKCSESVWPRSSNDMRKIAASAGVHCPEIAAGGASYNPVLQGGVCYWDTSYPGTRCGITISSSYTKFCPCIKQAPKQPKQCATGPKQCSHLASFSLLDSVVAFRNDQEAQTCMNSGMDAVARQVANTCTIKQVQGSIPCGTKCWPVLKPKILSVQSRCLEKKYSGLEKYNTCLLEHGCERPSAEQCRDTDHGYSDSGGDPCYRYHGHESWCGHYDTSYFHSHSMCCACGGGGWACPDQSAADVMKVQGAAYIMEGYISNISLQLSQTAPESPIAMTHANHDALSLTLAFIGGALAAIMLGFIALRRLKGKRSSAAGHLLA